MELIVHNIQGQPTSKKIKLSDEVFGVAPNDHVVYLAVKQFLANQRQGTHKTKDRSEVAYSTRKLLKQKGTGGARHGSRKAGIFVGGGNIHGPKPRDYGFKLNKKTKTLAKNSVLSSKANDNSIKIVEDFTFDAPKTKSYLEILKAFDIADKKSLLIISDNDTNVIMSGRNLPKATVSTTENINTYTLLDTDIILISEAAINKLNQLSK
ncbi:MAG: 50S ribosomal protein L4 [Cytophagales bacterium]|nr:50S ribosomal protein L4 [Cytophagales bacterium]